MFSRAASSQGDGMEKQLQIIIRDCVGRGVGSEELRAKRMDGTKLIDTEDEVFGDSTGVGAGESFRGKSSGEGSDGGVRSNGVKSSMDFGRGAPGRDIVDRGDEGTKALAFGAVLSVTESRGESRAGAKGRRCVGDSGWGSGRFRVQTQASHTSA